MTSYRKIEDLLRDLTNFPDGGRTVQMVVAHHTWSPDHAGFSGDRSVRAMMRFWAERQAQEGWERPVGGTFVVGPDGTVWQPYGLDVAVNAASNDRANRHGVSVEIVGNFDTGHDTLDGPQRHATVGLFAGLCVRYGLGPGDVHFHNDFQGYKSCPGTGFNKGRFRADVSGAMAWARQQMKPEAKAA